jgi:hypothetical protein
MPVGEDHGLWNIDDLAFEGVGISSAVIGERLRRGAAEPDLKSEKTKSPRSTGLSSK